MRLTIITSILCLANLRASARSAEDASLESTSISSSSPIETVIPNRSYLLKLDCISCPYLIRHSNREEWEKDPRPNQLTLALYIDGPLQHLYLQGEELNPLWYERRAPTFYNLPHPFAPPFTTKEIGVNETLQREENNNGYGMPLRQFELAYEYDMVTYAPKDSVREWEVLIQFEITGLRHEQHRPKDIPFSGSRANKRKEGAVPGVTSVVRLILGYTELEEMIITDLELMPREGMDQFGPEGFEALRHAAELKGNKSITTVNWGGRLHDINGPDGKDMYTEHVSFRPGEWNDCGRKDDWGRQMMCKVDDSKGWSPVLFVVSLVSVAILLLGLLILAISVSWSAVRRLRSKQSGGVVTAEGETDALLLFGNEELQDEGEKAEKEIDERQPHAQAVHMDDQQDSQQFGPYQHDVGTQL